MDISKVNAATIIVTTYGKQGNKQYVKNKVKDKVVKPVALYSNNTVKKTVYSTTKNQILADVSGNISEKEVSKLGGNLVEKGEDKVLKMTNSGSKIYFENTVVKEKMKHSETILKYIY